MKVYVLDNGDVAIGVYSTLDKAKERGDNFHCHAGHTWKEMYGVWQKGTSGGTLYVTEHVLDA